jgi:hypothetical protein
LVSDIYTLERAGGLLKASEGWCTVATTIESRPPADAALTAWLDQLLVDLAAEI